MNDKLNYQQAKRLREQSLSSVLADQLILGEGYGSAIGKTISLKTKAKIAGIKQKFDPLNIAKILTGGSRLGPAILGKMLGRSRKDIEFFAGRARPVTTRNKKIGGIPGGDEDTTGMSVVLNDILTFLHKSHEQDMILREKENNLREGEKHDDESRHKKLLKTLEKVGFGNGTASKVKSDKPGFFDGIFDSIKKFVQDMIDKAMQVFEWIGKLRPLLSFVNSGLFRIMSGVFSMAGPAALAALLAYGAKEVTEAVGQKQIDTAKDLLEKNKNRESLSEEEKTKLDKEIESAGGMKKLNQVMDTANAVPVTQRDVPPRPDTTGGKNKQRANSWDIKFAATHNWDGTPKTATGTTTGQTVPAGDNSVNDAEMAKLKRQNAASPTAAPVPTPPASAAVATKSTENQNLNIQVASKSMTTPKSNTNVVNNNVKGAPKPRAPIIAVRNTEPTFRQAIYNSTRVV